MKTILTERIFQFDVVGKLQVRVWVPDEGQDINYFDRLKEEIRDQARDMWSDPATLETMIPPHRRALIAKKICEEFPINAIEVKNNQGAGSVCYADWP
jgi:hypothetical protein